MLANALKFYELFSRRLEKGKKNSDISGSYDRSKKHLAIVFVSDTIPSPFFFIFSVASNEKNRKPQSGALLRCKLV